MLSCELLARNITGIFRLSETLLGLRVEENLLSSKLLKLEVLF